MPFVVTSCAFKTHRASGRGRGKPVLICILACSLGFHAITLERSIFTIITILRSFQRSVAWCCFLVRLLAENVTDRQAHRKSIVTLAALAPRGSITVWQ